ncbi:MAG: glycosyltransferase family 4 protein [Alphaproteobacteria bacterium]|nr:glycosyltransferase family 4 protein [Alphaproteobacteria bacterium]
MVNAVKTVSKSKSYPNPNSKKKPPVIMQVLPNLQMGGVERGTVEVAKAIVDKGWEAIVVSAGGQMVKDVKRVGARHIELPVDTKNPFTISENAKLMRAIIEQEGVDIVHARSRAPAWSAKKAAEMAGVKFLTTFHGTYGQGYCGLKNKYNRVMAEGDLVISISEFISRHMKKFYNTPEDKIRLVHRGVDTDVFSPSKISSERIMRIISKMNIPEDKHIVMLPGRLTRWKGQSVLIEAMARLDRDDVICLLVGSSQGREGYRRELEILAEKRGVAGMVYIVEDCDDIAATYMLADVVVSASTQPEAFGRVAIEGQAMGRVVIATDHGGSRETVIHNNTGFLVPPDDAYALRDALQSALGLNAKKRQDISSRAIDNVSKNFSTVRMCNKVLAVYEELLSSKNF